MWITDPHSTQTILEIDVKFLVDFLERENGNTLNVICVHGRHPQPHQIHCGGKQERRVTLSYELGAALVRYMSLSNAELKSDGTFVLTEIQKQSPAGPF